MPRTAKNQVYELVRSINAAMDDDGKPLSPSHAELIAHLTSQLREIDAWVPANGGSEIPFLRGEGIWFLWVWNPAQEKLGFLELETGTVHEQSAELAKAHGRALGQTSSSAQLRGARLGDRVAPTFVHLSASNQPTRIKTFLRHETSWRRPVPIELKSPPNKPILEFEGKPTWHEFIVLRLLERGGWQGVWVNNWNRAFWVQPGVNFSLPAGPKVLFETLAEEAQTGRGGAWDIYTWKNNQFLFVESKQRGKDRLSVKQLRWLEVAIERGYPITFVIAEYQRDS